MFTEEEKAILRCELVEVLYCSECILNNTSQCATNNLYWDNTLQIIYDKMKKNGLV